jgi:serine/threonine protein kinase
LSYRAFLAFRFQDALPLDVGGSRGLDCLSLEIEFAARRQISEMPALDEYRQRFAGYASVVEHQYNRFVKPHELEDYKILGLLGRGGMGVVYKARQVSLNRIVAVKMIVAGQLANAETLQRFLAEAESAANLHHPNIVISPT